MTEKVTIMKLKVDLQCSKCYKKVKKVLCKFPQIRDQVYDEKNNIVIIKVVCCSPEKLRDKICCKGRGAIKSIEIVEPPPPPPPKEPEKPKIPEKLKEPEKPKESEKPPPAPAPKPGPPKEPEKPKEKLPPPPAPMPQPPPVPVCPPARAVPIGVCCTSCNEGRPGGPCFDGYGGRLCPPARAVPIGVCCTSCYEGRPGGPCFDGYGGRPGPAPYCYDGYYGRPVCDSYGGGRPCYVSRCDEYLCEDNASACTIM